MISMKSKVVQRAMVAAVGIGLTAAATARADDVKAKGGQNENMEEMRRELASVKRVLAELLDMERRKIDILARSLESGGRPQNQSAESRGAPRLDAEEEDSSKTPKVAARRPPSLPPGKDDLTGVISGRVKSPAGEPAFVFVEDIVGRMVRGRTVVIKQENKQFSPRWAVAQVGTKFEFPNEDPVYHNVFSRSAGNSFDLGIYRAGDEAKSWIATRPGVIDVFCNMHPNMSSSVLVVPNIHYTEVKPDGTFMLPDVPTGRHKIVAWSPSSVTVSEWIDVTPGKEASLTFTLTEKGPGHTNKLGEAYGSYR